jgi:hypothetical protein
MPELLGLLFRICGVFVFFRFINKASYPIIQCYFFASTGIAGLIYGEWLIGGILLSIGALFFAYDRWGGLNCPKCDHRTLKRTRQRDHSGDTPKAEFYCNSCGFWEWRATGAKVTC